MSLEQIASLERTTVILVGEQTPVASSNSYIHTIALMPGGTCWSAQSGGGRWTAKYFKYQAATSGGHVETILVHLKFASSLRYLHTLSSCMELSVTALDTMPTLRALHRCWKLGHLVIHQRFRCVKAVGSVRGRLIAPGSTTRLWNSTMQSNA